MADLQKETDVSKARERLEDVARQKGGGTDMVPSSSDPASTKDISEKRIVPVKGKPKTKGFGRKLKEAMFGDIGDGSITEHIFFNIFIPSLKRVISDMGNTALNMALGLDPKTRMISSGNTHAGNASVYRGRNQSNQQGYNRRELFSEYYWDQERAQEIYRQLNELINVCNKITLEDVYSIMNMPQKIRSTDRYWGWTSMANIDIYQIDPPYGEDWVVTFPPAKPV